jgi:hypothetical protein
MWTLYQKLGYCINFTVSISSGPSFLPSGGMVSRVADSAAMTGEQQKQMKTTFLFMFLL